MDPVECIIFCSDCEEGFFRIVAPKLDGLFSYQPLLVHCGQFLFIAVERSGPIANRSVTFLFLYLKAYKSDFLVTSVSIECVRRAKTDDLINAFYSDAAAALSFSSNGPTVSVGPFLICY